MFQVDSAPTPVASETPFLTDRQAAEMFRVGLARWFELQKAEDFPAPIWLGPRGKRHERAALLKWAASRRGAPK